MAAPATDGTDSKVFSGSVGDDIVLEKFGYEPELKRTFGVLGMIGFSFSIVTSWSALSGVLVVGVESGGPPVMIWSWVGVCAVSLAVAYSMAEMCSAYPVAGGQYSWVAILAPKKWARGLSYVCGWFMLIVSFVRSSRLHNRDSDVLGRVSFRWAQSITSSVRFHLLL
ncbi:hypothetical protein B0J12DRAFT_187416 [Macrophomina phaseolina]|uniref:Amino acid/polyamine transporter I n=1 Tax=Macrophomina phaseolina TaxID=35725 RepID=A0ABQ8G3V9_9PEZI|nr:hypothetical protein B0J12DRAFT_187416 [Macrophomina phaseolina]